MHVALSGAGDLGTLSRAERGVGATKENVDLTQLLHEMYNTYQPEAAVKAGDPLSAQEIEALLSRRDLVERSSNCPHGRPTSLRLTLRDLERQFKRS